MCHICFRELLMKIYICCIISRGLGSAQHSFSKLLHANLGNCAQYFFFSIFSHHHCLMFERMQKWILCSIVLALTALLREYSCAKYLHRKKNKPIQPPESNGKLCEYRCNYCEIHVYWYNEQSMSVRAGGSGDVANERWPKIVDGISC